MNANNSESSAAGGILRSAVRGLIFWLASAIVLLPAGALICYLTPDPDKYLTAMAIAVLYLSAVIGGAASGGKGIISGLLTGLLATAVIIICSAFRGENDILFGPGLTAVLYCLVPVAAILGSGTRSVLFSKSKKPKRKKVNKKRR